MLHDDGWVQVACKGSHRQFKHPTKKGRVTVNGKPSDTLDDFLVTVSSNRLVGSNLHIFRNEINSE